MELLKTKSFGCLGRGVVKKEGFGLKRLMEGIVEDFKFARSG